MSRISSPLMTGMNLTEEERETLIQETRGPLALGMIFSFWGLAVIAVSLRMFVRIKLIKNAGLDDYLVAFSVAIATVMTIFISRQVHYGDGRHLLSLTLDQADNVSRVNFVAVVCWTFAITGTKVSILLQYLRLFKFGKLNRAIWVLLVIMVLSGISTLVVVLLGCIPVKALWDSKLRSGSKCLNQQLFWYFQSGFEVLTCFIMVGLLVPPFWKMQLPKSKRVGLIILLGLSSSACIVSILRMKSCFDAIPVSAEEVHDFTWTGIMPSIYAATELDVGIICCSLPALIPLRKYLSLSRFRAAQSRPQHQGPLRCEECRRPITHQSPENSNGQGSVGYSSHGTQISNQPGTAQRLPVPEAVALPGVWRWSWSRNHGANSKEIAVAGNGDERERKPKDNTQLRVAAASS